VNANSDSYRTASGTSSSAPLVSGAAAVILSAHPDWTPMEVREAMMMTADNADSPDNDYGYGVIDVMAAIDYETSAIDGNNVPEKFSVLNVYPNPFNPSTTIWFIVKSNYATSLQVYNIAGKLVETIVNDKLLPGEYAYTWKASGLPSGIYFVQLKTSSSSITQKITYLK
jgi:subtilisin family serine protease